MDQLIHKPFIPDAMTQEQTYHNLGGSLIKMQDQVNLKGRRQTQNVCRHT